MDTRQAKQAARLWIDANIGAWPGLQAAHLVGGITTMPDDAPFPASKDIDVHLVFAEGSPALETDGPFPNMIEVAFDGVSVEAGIKSVAEYRSAEVVLANPEVAHHLTVDSLLYDPCGLLGGLQDQVKREYPRRGWVLARLDHERRGLSAALGLRQMAAGYSGGSGEVNILGYTTTFPTAALWVATRNPPRMGSRMLLRVREVLAAYDRLDLHEELLALLGLTAVDPDRVEQFLREGTEAFDLAVRVKRTPGPFGHKLHPHLRPYFVESCRGMLDEGFHREALGWIVPCLLATTDVVLIDGPEAAKPTFAASQAGLLRALGLDSVEGRDAAYARANRLHEQIFALAEEIVAGHPGVVD